ncbi:hypothetical protein L6452_25636 [Arctium lappa]|uniref:Uncharacterized protein n=1 Tax=Arctium lappa TaxID=4217 RepID=A0ACB9ACC9_ARCLA|nr:hypothetical protein L6452_25636 [Arctium lappa]
MSVSSSHGDLPHTLYVSHLESSGIEARGPPPQSSTSFYAPMRLEPLADIVSLARTHTPSSAIVGRLSDPAGTPIVTLPIGRLQGLGGSPTATITTPVVNVGGTTVPSTVLTTTGSLSHPGVTLPEFVTREHLDDALKAFQTRMKVMIKTKVDKLKHMIEDQSVITEPASHTHPPPPPPTDYTIGDLKTMLLAKLLSQSQTKPSTDADLVSILRSHVRPTPPTPPPNISPDAIQNFTATLQSMQRTLATLTDRVTSLETTCKGQAQGLKRLHDDQDDPDHHEGEKRPRVSKLETIHLMELAEAQKDTPTGTQNEEQGQTQDQDMGMEMAVYTEANTTVEKPEDGDRCTSDEPDEWAISDPQSEINPSVEQIITERAVVAIQAEVEDLCTFDDEEFLQQRDYDNLFEHILQDYQPAELYSVNVPLLIYSTDHPTELSQKP